MIAAAADEVATALSDLGEAYELLDERNADALEEQLFRPVQGAYGKLKTAHAEFAARSGLATRAFAARVGGAPSTGTRGFVDNATAAATRADLALVELQDSMLPVEAGDAELRARLTEVRQLLSVVPARAREFTRTLGR